MTAPPKPKAKGARRAVVIAGAAVVLAIAGAGLAVVTHARTTAGPPPQPAPTGPLTSAVDAGAVPKDKGDDAAALQRALDQLKPGGTLTIPAGVYRHSTMLTIRVPNVTITGAATLLATNEADSAVRIDADGVVLKGLTLGVESTTHRSSEPAQQKLWISGHTGDVVENVTITGSAAAGVFVDGAANFRLTRVHVSDTRADGIHITGGSHDGVVDHPVVARTGDDGVAVVSYESDRAVCKAITITSPQVLGTNWGRGISVVGGSDITYTDVLVQDTNAAAVYIAVEGDPYYTAPVDHVSVRGGRLLRANNNAAIDHGAVVVLAGRPDAAVQSVNFSDLAVDDTRATASHAIGVVTSGGAPAPQDLHFDRVTFQGGPATQYGGDVPSPDYTVS